MNNDICHQGLAMNDVALWIDASGKTHRVPSQRQRLRNTSPGHRILREFIFDRDLYTCQVCGIHSTKYFRAPNGGLFPMIEPRDGESSLEIDHIIPWAKGGAHHPDNLQTICGPCNNRKGTRTEDKPE